MNSTSVTGKFPPAPAQGPPPLPHSPVRQTSVQNVLAQILPDHGGGISILCVACEASSNPVVDGCDPAPVSAAGQIVYGQPFLIMNVADSPPAISIQKIIKVIKIFIGTLNFNIFGNSRLCPCE